MKVLVTGAGGFVGRHLAEQLGAGHEVLAPTHAELDLLQGEAVRDYLERERRTPSCTAPSGPATAARRGAAGEVLHANLRMFFNLARWRACSAGWCCSAPVRCTAPTTTAAHAESYFGDVRAGGRVRPLEVRVRRLCRARPDVVELRLFGVFGPGEDYAIRFISNAVCKALCDLPLTIKQNRRFDYLWVEDVAPVVEHFLQHTGAFPAYNVCADAATSCASWRTWCWPRPERSCRCWSRIRVWAWSTAATTLACGASCRPLR